MGNYVRGRSKINKIKDAKKIKDLFLGQAAMCNSEASFTVN